MGGVIGSNVSDIEKGILKLLPDNADDVCDSIKDRAREKPERTSKFSSSAMAPTKIPTRHIRIGGPISIDRMQPRSSLRVAEAGRQVETPG